MKSKFIKSALLIGVITLSIISCNKGENIPIELQTTKISPSEADGGVTTIVHTFFDGTSSEDAYLFGCKGAPTNCFNEFVVTGSAAANLNNIIPQLDGNSSLAEVAYIVSNNYEDLNLFASSTTLDLVINQDCNLEVGTDGNLHYFIFSNLTNNTVIAVYPVQL